MGKIPVNIISGFLGAGKTTTIISLLSQKTTDEQWAVIINEFGRISIDSQTLCSSSETGTVFEISGGCICCSARRYFQENLEKIVREERYSRIIIEPSGLGGIDMVSEIVTVNPDLILMPVICIVDITIIENPRLQLLPVYQSQIFKADVILFSKCDLLVDYVTQKRLVGKFKSLFPSKQNYLLISSPMVLENLFDMGRTLWKEETQFSHTLAVDPKITDNNFHVKNYIFPVDAIFDSSGLTHFFNNNPFIIRAKGHIQNENGWNLVNYSLSGCIFEPCLAKKQNEIIIIVDKSDSSQLQNLYNRLEKTMITKCPFT